VQRIKPPTSDQLADFVLDNCQRVHMFPNTTAAPGGGSATG
jgi:hypothetical protein